MSDRGSGIDVLVYGHCGRRFVVTYGRLGTITHGGLVWLFYVAVQRRQCAALIRVRDAIGLFGVGEFVAWDGPFCRCHSWYLCVIMCVD